MAVIVLWLHGEPCRAMGRGVILTKRALHLTDSSRLSGSTLKCRVTYHRGSVECSSKVMYLWTLNWPRIGIQASVLNSGSRRFQSYLIN